MPETKTMSHAFHSTLDMNYKCRFLAKTQERLDNKVEESHIFLEASLAFRKGKAVWTQDMPVIDLAKLSSPSNLLRNQPMEITSAEHAYELLKNYLLIASYCKFDAYRRSISDLERYCR